MNTIIFSIILAFAVTVPAAFETEIQEMSREEIEENISTMNTTIRLSENNLVIIHTDLHHDKIYKDLFRMLFNFLTSQVNYLELSQFYIIFKPHTPTEREAS